MAADSPALTQHPLPFNALDFDATNLVAWYSSRVPLADSSQPTDGDSLTTWYDKSGNARDQALQAGTLRWREAGFGTDMPSMEFLSTGAHSRSGSLEHPGEWTAYAVVKSIGTSPSVRGVVNADNNAADERQAQYLRWSANNAQAIGFTASTAYTATKAGTSTNLTIMAAKRGESSITVYLNGAAGTAVSSNTTLNTKTVWLGLNASAEGTAYSGNLHYGEVLLYSGAHDDTTRQAIESALAGVYGLPVALVVADSTHAVTSDEVTLTAHGIDAVTLTVADAAHAHTADSPTLTQHHVLTVADAAHAHTADSPALTAHGIGAVTLVVQDASSSQFADTLTLTQHHVLAVDDAAHAHTVDNVVFVFVYGGRAGAYWGPRPTATATSRARPTATAVNPY
jgi:hypothetical protein